jgi:hypothetical protein
MSLLPRIVFPDNGTNLLALFFTLQSDLIIKKSMMEKWIIKGKNAPNCHNQSSSPFDWCVPTLGGVPRYWAIYLNLIFCKKEHKDNRKIVFGKCVNTPPKL